MTPTARNNVAPTKLLHPVFNNLLQLIIFDGASDHLKAVPRNIDHNLPTMQCAPIHSPTVAKLELSLSYE